MDEDKFCERYKDVESILFISYLINMAKWLKHMFRGGKPEHTRFDQKCHTWALWALKYIAIRAE